MATVPDAPSRKASVSGRVRSSVSYAAGTPSSPHTPIRPTSSIYGSPGASFRSDDDPIIFEIGSRFLRGGFSGESTPRCTMSFGPDEQRRVGDYRKWMPGYSTQRKKRRDGLEWGQDYELWNMRLDKTDLGLVEDKVERALREAYGKWFMLDPKPRKVVLALPSIMPRPLLSSVLTVLFGNFLVPNITLFSAPMLDVVAAGLRSALVIDVGWAETTITAVYEYREVLQRQSVRAGKLLSKEMGRVLTEESAKNYGRDEPDLADEVSFEEADEVLVRMGWCMNRDQAASIELHQNGHITSEDLHKLVSVPILASNPPLTLRLPFYRLASPTETALFARETRPEELDLNELPLHLLAYNTLLSLPIDIRKSCISRIIVTGGLSHLPGIKSRLVSELEQLISTRGWNPVRRYGSAPSNLQEILKEKTNAHKIRLQANEATKHTESTDSSVPSSLSAAFIQLDIDPVEEKLRQQNNPRRDHEERFTDGVVRGVETLGAWAGASLLGALKIKGVVEIERERFLQHGLSGATREKDVSVVPQRQSIGPNVKTGFGERNSWTLGSWA